MAPHLKLAGLTAMLMILLVVSDPAATKRTVADQEHQVIDRTGGCDYVEISFPYCLEFLTGLYYKPSPKCCNHIRKLNMVAKHRKGNARMLCYCVEAMVRGTQPRLLASRIAELPLRCYTYLSFPISSSMDCSQVTT